MKITSFLILLAAVFLTSPVYAADNATVNATVTLQHVSISVDDGAIHYGVMSLNSSAHTVDLTDTQTVTNEGNVAVDILIKGQHSPNWALGSSAAADHLGGDLVGCHRLQSGYRDDPVSIRIGRIRCR